MRRHRAAPAVDAHDAEWRAWLNERGCGCWSDWLQKFGIELNAMPPAKRVAWLTKNMAGRDHAIIGCRMRVTLRHARKTGGPVAMIAALLPVAAEDH